MNAFFARFRPAQVIGPLGEQLTFESLPPVGTTRWVARRKAEVLAAIKGDLLTLEEACERYDLSLAEFILWQRAAERSGVLGLRVKHIQSSKARQVRQDEYRTQKSDAVVEVQAPSANGSTH